jgi:hypothetical protein
MLVGGDFEHPRIEPEHLPFDTFDRVSLAVLGSFPLIAAARLLGVSLAWVL